MNNASFTIDEKKVIDMFKELTSKERHKVFRKTIQSALNIVKKQAISNLKGAVKPSKINKKDKWNNSFRKGIKTKVYKDNQAGVIHILANFKLKFFENGTDVRFNKKKGSQRLKKARNTGSIKAYHFFSRAKTSKEREVFNSINKLLTQSIQKINNKYKK